MHLHEHGMNTNQDHSSAQLNNKTGQLPPSAPRTKRKERSGGSSTIRYGRSTFVRLGLRAAVMGFIGWLWHWSTTKPKAFMEHLFTISCILNLLVFGVFILPVVIVVLLAAPTFILQLLLLIPLWTLYIAKFQHPADFEHIFLEELVRIEPSLGQGIRKKLHQWPETHLHNKAWSYSSNFFFEHNLRFAMGMVLLGALSTVSFLSVVGQAIMVADCLAWALMSTYTRSCCGMTFTEEKKWMAAHRWPLLGMTMPYVFLMAMPLLGPLFLGHAQVAAAHLLRQFLSAEEHAQMKKRNNMKPHGMPQRLMQEPQKEMR
ncbi:hypothetical protein QOT17_001406 [Balamuthia mandrillaris]